MTSMHLIARIDVWDRVQVVDTIAGVRFEIVAPEFAWADHSAVYCETVEDAVQLVDAIRCWRAGSALPETPPEEKK